MPEIFDIIILIGRPAAGKSEIIDYLQHTPDELRRERFHIGDLQIIDDFPMIWTWFEEDYILSQRLNKPRLHTDADGYFKDQYQWQLLIERLGLEYDKFIRDNSDTLEGKTIIIEFSRGAEHGGYQEAFRNLSPKILAKAAILYVSVPFTESIRKNRLRFNPERPDSILEHALPDQKMTRLYQEDDWTTFCSPDPNYLKLNSIHVPYVIFENQDDITSASLGLLGQRLEVDFKKLWHLETKINR